MPRKKSIPAIKPTTMRIPPELKRRLKAVAKRQDRSSSYLAIRFIEAGVAKFEREHAKTAGALD